MGKYAIVVALLVGLSNSAFARDDGRYANGPLKRWFDNLTSGNGKCCSFADGLSISDVGCDRSLREISACLGALGTPASASRRSAAATIAARASAPRAIVAPCTAPNDKAWGATPAPRHADQPGLHDRPDCRRRA